MSRNKLLKKHSKLLFIKRWFQCLFVFSARNFCIPFLGLTPNSSNVLNAVQIHRSVDNMLTNEQAIDCEITDQTTSSWTIYKLEDDPRDPIPLTGLRKSLIHTEISTSDLLIPGRFLPYGFYEIVARVEMKGLRGVFGTASTHIQVIQTPWLEAAVIAGSFHTVPYGFQVHIVIQYFITGSLYVVYHLLTIK